MNKKTEHIIIIIIDNEVRKREEHPTYIRGIRNQTGGASVEIDLALQCVLVDPNIGRRRSIVRQQIDDFFIVQLND